MTRASKTRVRYPNRTVFFGIEAGLVDPKEHQAKVEEGCRYRLMCYLYGSPGELVVESFSDFKERFAI